MVETRVVIGSSTHNEWIEHLWRDVHRSVITAYGNIHSLENESSLRLIYILYLPSTSKKIASGISEFIELSFSIN